jgi:hypothetical protein
MVEKRLLTICGRLLTGLAEFAYKGVLFATSRFAYPTQSVATEHHATDHRQGTASLTTDA